MNTEGFYRRALPPQCIAFSSKEGRKIFAEALALGGMEGYFALAEQFHTQVELQWGRTQLCTNLCTVTARCSPFLVLA